MSKLKTCTDSEEREELEDQILRLVEQDEIMENITKPISENNTNTVCGSEDVTNNISNLDEQEQVRMKRDQTKKDKETKYHMDNKLESKEDELIRQEMMNAALDFNEDYAFRKSKNNNRGCAKNKSKR